MIITYNINSFAKSNLDLGKTSFVKHEIKLKPGTNPVKDQYCKISSSLYNEVWSYLKQMLEIGAIKPSKGPWASPVILVMEEDFKLRFSIDLRKVNDLTIKYAYSIPCN